MFHSVEYDTHSPVGKLTLASNGDAICGLWMQGQRYYLDTLPEKPVPQDDDVLKEFRSWLDAYFAGKKPAINSLPLAPIGSEFRQKVWQILCEIPYGQVTTYGEIAQEIKARGGKAAPIAVGGAVGHNPISITIPCHRVVGSDGSLTGYSGGVNKKLWLLEFEGVDMSRLYVPKKGTALYPPEQT